MERNPDQKLGKRMNAPSQQPHITTKDGRRRFACSPVAILVFIVNEEEEMLLLAHSKRGGSWEVDDRESNRMLSNDVPPSSVSAPDPLTGTGRRDSRRSGAEMGDGHSGLLPRPIAPPKGVDSVLEGFPSNQLYRCL